MTKWSKESLVGTWKLVSITDTTDKVKLNTRGARIPPAS
jgi:hypothetical protein